MRHKSYWRPSRVGRIVSGVVLALLIWRFYQPTNQPSNINYDDARLYYVKRAVDGDTLLLDDGERVRLFGVDTPETEKEDTPGEPLGEEAYQFTRDFAEGKQIRMEFDRERRDQYHRILAYVYVGDRMLNEELIRAGLTRAETRFAYSPVMQKRFVAVEREAREARRGLWATNGNSNPNRPMRQR